MKRTLTICLVGRPNVGKSTLFNKLTGTRDAIVDNTPGVTRDRMFGSADLGGLRTHVIDTGGFEPVTENELVAQVREQALVAIEEADVICFVVDSRAGMTPVDEEIASALRKSGKPTVIAVNKIDTPKNENDLAEFYALGFDHVVAVSAEHSLGLGDLEETLLDNARKTGVSFEAVPDQADTNDEEKAEKEPITIAVIGCPNAGKSSLANKLLGEDRMMVSNIPGTTRDSVDSLVTWHGKEFVFIDTAGIRKKNRISQKLEKYAVIMALRSIGRAQLALLVIDATKGITDQDARIAGIVQDEARACIVLVNKWDLVEKDSLSTERFREDLREKLKFLSFAPILFVSAKTGQRTGKIFETIDAVMNEYRKRVDTGPLNRIVKAWVETKPPPVTKGHRAKFFYASQPRTAPPTFSFVVSRPECVPQPFRRFLANRLRQEYGFEGAPVVCLYRPRKQVNRKHA